MGMWTVEPDVMDDGAPLATVIHLDTIIRAAHLLPVFGSSFVPEDLYFNSLDVYHSYFVNNNVNHHCHEYLS